MKVSEVEDTLRKNVCVVIEFVEITGIIFSISQLLELVPGVVHEGRFAVSIKKTHGEDKAGEVYYNRNPDVLSGLVASSLVESLSNEKGESDKRCKLTASLGPGPGASVDSCSRLAEVRWDPKKSCWPVGNEVAEPDGSPCSVVVLNSCVREPKDVTMVLEVGEPEDDWEGSINESHKSHHQR